MSIDIVLSYERILIKSFNNQIKFAQKLQTFHTGQIITPSENIKVIYNINRLKDINLHSVNNECICVIINF